MEVCPDGSAEFNRSDMEQLGVVDGDKVKITSPEGLWIQVKAKRSRRPRKGTIIVPQHFSALKVNTLTAWDTPLVKVSVEKV